MITLESGKFRPARAKLGFMLAAGCLAVLPAQAGAQETGQESGQQPAASATDPINFITPTDLENAMSLIRGAEVSVEPSENGFEITLPSGITADARLQNCEDAATYRNCRTVSLIINMFNPGERDRAQLLEIVNDLNKRDINGRAFLNDSDHIIARFAFVASGNETLRQLAYKIISWEATTKLAIQSLYPRE